MARKNFIYPLSDSSVELLNRQFIQIYDYKSWLYRLRVNELIIENADGFIEEFGEEKLEDEGAYQMELALKAEGLANFYHITETLFNLMYSFLNYEIPWIGMRHTTVGDIKSNLLQGKILKEELTEEEVRFLFYHGIEEDERIEPSVEFIQNYLKEMGDIFFDTGDFYKEYKHGYRASVGKSSLSATREPTENNEPFSLGGSEAVTYLKDKDVEETEEEIFKQLKSITDGFNYDRYQEMSMINYTLIKNMFITRKELAKEEGDDEVELQLFPELTVEELFKDIREEPFQFTMTIPGGKKQLKIER